MRDQELLRSRSLAVFAYLALAFSFLVLIARLFHIQVRQHDFFRGKAQSQVLRIDRPVGSRGRILDSSGEALAFSVRAPRLMAHPHLLGDQARRVQVAQELAQILGTPASRLASRLEIPSPCVTLKTKVFPPERVEAVRRWIGKREIKGLRFEDDEWRVYPHGSLAAHAIGFVGDDNHGLGGLELALDDLLAGREGFMPYERDGLANRIDSLRLTSRPPLPGCDVLLTLDPTIQDGLEAALDDLVQEHHPDGVAGIVMSPQTGGILALSNRPTFAPHTPGACEGAARRNRVVTDPYEPGSTIKPFILAAALEAGVVGLGEVVDCEGGRKHFGRRLVKDVRPNQALSIPEILVRSSNVGMSKIGLRVGCGPMFDAFDRMSVGRVSGVDLPGETPGLLTPREDWSENYTLVSVSFGYEIAFTPIKLASLYCGIANRGWMMTPHLVRTVLPPEGGAGTYGESIAARQSSPGGRRIMAASTADGLRHILRRVVLEGSGKKADLPGFGVAGKSGTSQRWVRGKKDGYNSSFVAFAPYEDPRVLVLIVAYGTKGAVYYGGDVAGPAVKKTLECARARLEIIGDFGILNRSVSTVGDFETDSPFARSTSAREGGNKTVLASLGRRSF